MRPGLYAAIVAASLATTASAGLPLRQGTYVQADTPCRDAPFAAMMSYDGKGLGDPHDAQCTSRVLGRAGGGYRVSTTCRANGDGSPATPTTQIATLRFPSKTSFIFAAQGTPSPGSLYRLCPAAAPGR